MKVILPLVLILDMSGSMYQKMGGVEKHKTLTTQLDSMVQSLPPDLPLKIISYGTKERSSCESLDQVSLQARGVSTWLNKKRPGQYAKSPLAGAIAKAGKLAKKYELQNVIVVTDGADTCGQDPCAALRTLSDSVSSSSTQVRLDLIGFDTRKFRKKLDCNERLPGIEFKYHGVQSRTQFQSTLTQIDENLKLNLASSKTGWNQKSKERARPAAQSSKIGKRVSEGRRIEATLLKVKNSPSEARFQAVLKASKEKFQKKWSGSFSVPLPPGVYEVSIVSVPRGQQKLMPVILEKKIENGKNQLLYQDFFKNAQAKLRVDSAVFSYELEFRDEKSQPEKQETLSSTKSSSKENPGGIQKIQSDVHPRTIRSFDLRPGEWRMTVRDPWWLKEALFFDFQISPNETRDFQFKEMAREQIQFYRKPSSKRRFVVIVTDELGHEKRILLSKKNRSVPLMKHWERLFIPERKKN